jgi:hypothetical protein
LPTASNEIKMDGKMAAGLELLYGVSYWYAFIANFKLNRWFNEEFVHTLALERIRKTECGKILK